MQETTYSRWLISDMYYPSESIEGPIKSHEAICDGQHERSGRRADHHALF